jgi:N12 class adenine-specific DNA methylase
MVMAAMELRRLGSASKPAVVVPNHMLEQFSREWLQLYPTARILVADRERLSKARRKEFVARAATGDWDGIVFTQSGFARLAPRPRPHDRLPRRGDRDGPLRARRLEGRQGAVGQEARAAHRPDGGDLQAAPLRAHQGRRRPLRGDRHRLPLRRRSPRLQEPSGRLSIDGVANTGSQRAQDLDSKLWALRRLHGPRIVTFATATPVANSMAELWVMQSYLHPDLLASVDLRAFDAWAANFGRTHTALELAPDGASYRMQTRFARFQNVPELLTLYRQVADVRTNDDLDLPVPALAGGQAETVVVEPSDVARRLRRRPRRSSRVHPQPGRRPERGQHVEGHRRRPPRRARPPTRRRRRHRRTEAS